MTDLISYCKKNKEKTLFIFCNDCQHLSKLVSNADFLVATAFANVISSLNGFDYDYFKYQFEKEGVRKVVIVGHTNCQILELLSEDQSDNKNWKQAKSHINALERNFGKFTSLSRNDKLFFLNT